MQTISIPDRLPIRSSVDVSADVLCVARAANGEEVFAGASNGLIYHVDLAAEKPVPKVIAGGHQSYVSGIASWQDVVVSAGSDRRLVWWDRQTHKCIRTVEQAHTKWIRRISRHPTTGVLASVGDDMVCRLWDLESAECLAELKGHTEFTPHHFRNKLFTCAFARDGSALATADQYGHVVVWDFLTHQPIATIDATKFYEWDRSAEALNGHSYGGVRALDFSPDGENLAIGGVLNGDAAITNGQALLQVYAWKSAKMVTEYTDGGNFFYECVRYHHANEWIVATPGAGEGTHINFFHPQEPKLIKKSEGIRIYDMLLNESSDVMYVVGAEKIAAVAIHANENA